MVNFPEPVAQALRILRSSGIPANVYRMYGTKHIQFVISLPDVEIEETNEHPEPNSVDRPES